VTESPDPREATERPNYPHFLARVAHDLRSPLGVVLHVLRELSNELAPHLTDEHSILLSAARRRLSALQAFVDGIGLISDVGSANVEVVNEPCDLAQVAQIAIDTSILEDARPEVGVSYDAPERPCIVRGDPRLLTLLVTELVKHGLLRARRNVRLAIERSTTEARLSVEDDGEGIPPDGRTAQFEWFTTRPGASSALGLSIANYVAEAHGGSLRPEPSTLPPVEPGTVGVRVVFSVALHASPNQR
jgi:two-component system OmpR family sensor kinase